MFRTVTALLLVAFATPAYAQERAIRDAELPRGVESRLLALVRDSATNRMDGPTDIPRDVTIQGDLVVVGGLDLDGQVTGDLVIVDGDLAFGSSARVGGDVFVINGQLDGDVLASIGGSLTVYGDIADQDRAGPGVRVRVDDPWEDEDDEEWEDGRHTFGHGRAKLGVRLGPGYNRVEGLPIRVGPEITTGGGSPLQLRAYAIWRTENGSFDENELGWDATLDQRIAPAALVLGGGVFSVIDPIEDQGLSDLENGLGSFLFHNDYRDHVEREGWRLFARWEPRTLPVELSLTYRDEEFAALPSGDPWSLTDGDEPWRLQPLVALGHLRSVVGEAELDTRRRHDADAWRAKLSLKQGIEGDLALPARTFGPGDGTTVPLPATRFQDRFTTVTGDLRRYVGVGWGSQLALRVFGGGAVGDDPLPPQFQHALGGIGSLPGYEPFSFDCGARVATVEPVEGERGTFFPFYGCDRVALFQAEYRGGIDLDIDWGDWNDWDEDEDEDWRRDVRRADRHGWHDVDWDWEPSWVVFVDGAQGWSLRSDGSGDTHSTGAFYDAGLGLLLGDFGIYWAFPLNDSEEGSNFFIRLGKRF